MSDRHLAHWPPGLTQRLTLPETNIFHNVEVSAARYPDKPSLVFYDTPVTFGRVTGDKRYNAKALDVLNNLLTSDNLTPPLRALIFSSRGVALDNLGDDDNALRDHNEAVRLDPSVSILETRAGFHEQNGDYALARADRARAAALRQK